MELNVNIKIESVYDKESKENKLTIGFNKEVTPSELLTVIKQAEISTHKMLDNYIDNNFSGSITEDEFENLLNTPCEEIRINSVNN